jgi:hypothetical protein
MKHQWGQPSAYNIALPLAKLLLFDGRKEEKERKKERVDESK